jgi:hypothetical protein
VTDRNVVSGLVEVSNEDNGKQLIAAPGPTLFLWIESLGISVSKAAQGGGGEVIVKDTNGDVVWRINADGVKDFSVPCGENGIQVGPGVGLVVAAANAAGEQATASVGVSARFSFR